MNAPASAVGGLECRLAAPGLAGVLAQLFAALEQAGDSAWFHPHPFTRDAAEQICSHDGLDLYYLLLEGESVRAYGFLRGWDEGFEVPSLGIAVHPEERGHGLGLLLMTFLHAAARRRGAPAVRLKVYPENERAVELYRALGYVFEPERDGPQLVARLSL